MQQSFFLALSALAPFASAGSIGFHELDGSVSCGAGESVMVCTEPACQVSVNDIAGCTGTTKAIAGACSNNIVEAAGEAAATTTESVCDSATVVLNHCHQDASMCVDFFNQAGDKWRITCPGGTRVDVPCDTPAEGTCHDIGLGDC